MSSAAAILSSVDFWKFVIPQRALGVLGAETHERTMQTDSLAESRHHVRTPNKIPRHDI